MTKNEKFIVALIVLLGIISALTFATALIQYDKIRTIAEYGNDGYFMAYQNGEQVMDEIEETKKLPDNFKDLRMSKELRAQFQLYVLSATAQNQMDLEQSDSVMTQQGLFWRKGPGQPLNFVPRTRR